MAGKTPRSPTTRPTSRTWRGRDYRLSLDRVSGLPAVSFLGSGWIRAMDACALIRSPSLGTRTVRLGAGTTRIQIEGKSRLRIETAAQGPLRLAVTYRLEPGGMRIGCSLTNLSGGPVELIEVRPLDVRGRDRGWRLPGGTQGWRAFIHGWSTASPSGSVPLESGGKDLRLRFPPERCLPQCVRAMIENEPPARDLGRGAIRGEWVLGLEGRPGSQALAIGFLGFRKHFSPIVLDLADRSLSVVAQTDGIELAPDESFETEDLWLGFEQSGRTALETWAALAAASTPQPPRPPCRTPLVLWCSWYSGLYGSVDERSFLANLVAFRSAWKGDAYFQLDDGYEHAIGDWLATNGKFPGGLEDLARRIRSEGLRPAIWLAPFAVEKRSRLFREHPDWILKSRDGRPRATGLVPGPGRLPRLTYSLDTTHPGVLEHLMRTAQTLTGWGYELLKIDFLTAGAAAGIRHDRRATRADAYARGMEALRSGAGNALLMAAIAPVLADAGWVDIQRVGPDVAFGRPAWTRRWQEWANDRASPGVRNNLEGSFARSFLDGRLWVNDPDAMVWAGLTQDEVRTLVTAKWLLGGVLAIGHDFSGGTLDLSVVSELLTFERHSVDYADLFEPEASSTRMLTARAARQGLRHVLVALFNSTERTQTRRLAIPPGFEPAEADIADFWDPGAGPWKAGAAVPVPARGCRLFIVPSRPDSTGGD